MSKKPVEEVEVTLSRIACEMKPEVDALVAEIGVDQVRKNLQAGLERLAENSPSIRAMLDAHYRKHPPA